MVILLSPHPALAIVLAMQWIIGIGAAGLITTLFVGMFLILRGSFRLMRDSIENLQRSSDLRSSTLRTELSSELQNNRKELQLGLSQATTSLEQRVTAIDTRIDARLKEMSQGVQTKLEQNVKEGFRHFEKVQEHLKLAEVQLTHLNSVGQSINDLNSLLKMPHLRGGFGEATLERILSDILPTDAYELQYQISPNSTERVDAVVKYPKFVLPIDSKFPREQLLPLFETGDPVKLEIARKNLVEVMKQQGKSIREKYIKPELGTSEMALLFLASETLYFEVLRHPTLGEDLSRHKVFVVSPNTLAVTLHSISIARGYYEMAKGVEKTISEVKKASQHFENFERKFDELGNSLTKAQSAFNTASTHLSRYGSAVTRLTGSESRPVEVLPEEPPKPQISSEPPTLF